MSCSLAQRTSKKKHRDSHKEEIRAYMATYNGAHREERREKDAKQQRWFTGNLRILKQAQGCAGCGTSKGLLDHHHIDPSTKTYSVSHMYNNSLEKFIDEIAKCTVLCRPCHRKRHVELSALAA